MPGTDRAYVISGCALCVGVRHSAYKTIWLALKPGTCLWHGSTSLHACYAMSATYLGHGASSEGWICRWPFSVLFPAIRLRVCYAMSGTHLAHGAIKLRACYALSGTGLAYGAICLRVCYAMSGTDVARSASRLVLSAYANTMRYPVLT
eukprot:836579-Rhodomonas_salina.2